MYCQKCRTPLKADGSLETLNPAAFDLLIGSTSRSLRKSANSNTISYPPERKDLYDKSVQGGPSPLFKRNIPAPITGEDAKLDSPHAWSERPDMSFVEITESQIMPALNPEPSPQSQPPNKDGTHSRNKAHESALSVQLQRHDRLYSILSSHSDIDHPICSECSMMLIAAFNARLTSATKERDAYAAFLKTLQQNRERKSPEAASQDELEALLTEEETALSELKELEITKSQLEIELANLEEESRQFDLREEKFWTSRNAFDNRLHDLEVDLTSLQQKYTHDQQQLEQLQRTNVYNDTFCIGHDGYFGTINGLRLGRLPNQNVEWAEINAAWGQTLLLLATVAERLSFTFKNYRLRPLGSTSRIEKLEWPQQPPGISRSSNTRALNTASPPPKVTQLDLFSSGDIPLGRVFNHRRFDVGMVAFLDCLSQLGAFVEKTSKAPSGRTAPLGTTKPSSLILPYPIEGDRIGGVSIRLGVGFSQDENFTKACKYALTCCKFLLAHVSNLEGARPS